jgi:GT2 family glycosyltransferase
LTVSVLSSQPNHYDGNYNDNEDLPSFIFKSVLYLHLLLDVGWNGACMHVLTAADALRCCQERLILLIL